MTFENEHGSTFSSSSSFLLSRGDLLNKQRPSLQLLRENKTLQNQESHTICPLFRKEHMDTKTLMQASSD